MKIARLSALMFFALLVFSNCDSNKQNNETVIENTTRIVSISAAKDNKTQSFQTDTLDTKISGRPKYQTFIENNGTTYRYILENNRMRINTKDPLIIYITQPSCRLCEDYFHELQSMSKEQNITIATLSLNRGENRSFIKKISQIAKLRYKHYVPILICVKNSTLFRAYEGVTPIEFLQYDCKE